MSELRKKAKKKVNAKVTFYTCLIVFSCATVMLLMLSFYLTGIAIWLILPIPAFLLVLGVLYIDAFGFSLKRTGSENWREAEIEKEMDKLSRQKETQLPDLEDVPSTAEQLELKKLETLKRAAEDEDYV